VALHTGSKVSLTLHPAEQNSGITFRRTDVTGSNDILARWDNVVETQLSTKIGNDQGVTVGTIEHLMAALSGCGVDNAFIEVNGPEVPVMDGSAQPFVSLIEGAGLYEQDASSKVIEILKPVRVEIGDKLAELTPGNNFCVSCDIDFYDTLIVNQSMAVTVNSETFKRELAKARTFGFMHEVERLKEAGLGLGGSLDNAVIVDGNRILNKDGLRYKNEFARHKVLDAIGDLYTAGGKILGNYRGIKSGHSITNQLLRALFADETAWRYGVSESQIIKNLVNTSIDVNDCCSA
jgi:UDP-3-O-[3-hydroxymyristoyl] N-acetylglucosamine deacetylase